MKTELYKGVIVRDNYMDKWIVDEMDKEYKYILSQCEGKVVMDIGANLGAFTRKALDAGAEHVICIEPERENFSLLLQNGSIGQCTFVNRAVTLVDDEAVTLYVNSGNNKGLHTIMPDWLASSRPDCTTQEVLTKSIYSLLDEYKPEVLKVDIEGGEVVIADVLRNLPHYVKHVAIEFDTISDTYLDTIKLLLADFNDADRNKFFTGSRK